jgi:hypothetical protein
MRRQFAAFLLAIVLIACSPVAASRPDSVQPLQNSGRTFCTAFSINERDGLWGTAGHCAVITLKLGTVTIGGSRAEVIAIDPHWDLAVLQSDLRAPAIPLFAGELRVGDSVEIQGFPYGLAKKVTTFGRVAALAEPIDEYHVSNVLDVTVAGGNSGSPVLNNRGQLAGVLWGSFIDSPHSLAVPHFAVRMFFTPFTEQR